MLCVLALAWWNSAPSRAQASQDVQAEQSNLSDAERSSYADALAYCRGDVPRPMALREDKRVLCFDGMIENVDPWMVYSLAQGGLFVVRSAGGEILTTIQLASILSGKLATIIINDYCLANCANYIFIASLATFVPKDSLVAWRNVGVPGECARFFDTRDPGAPHFGVGPCPSEFHDGRRNEYLDRFKRDFFDGRIRGFQFPPESLTIRRIIKRKFDETGKYPEELFWTWNPRFYSMYVRTKVAYEAYPQSQDDVDAIAARVGVREHIIYDP